MELGCQKQLDELCRQPPGGSTPLLSPNGGVLWHLQGAFS